MKKTKFLAVFAGVISALPCMVGAAYPVYNPQQLAKQGYVINNYPQNTNIMPQQMAAAAAVNGRPMVTSIAATNPNRVTGALPRVGSSATNAGRQYYQAADYDRLAESGLYIGLSAGYTAMASCSISADYTGEQNSFFAPGAFRDADVDKDTVIPLQISVGAAINSDIRLDFSFLRYKGLSYPGNVQTYSGEEYVNASVSGGAITSNSTMLNLYYNLDSFTGYMMGGSLRPYVGLGVGLALNTIADYVVYDNGFYPEVSVEDLPNTPAGEVTGVSDIYAYHNGGTTEQFAFGLEAGVTTDMNEGLKLDFFVRYANLGKIKTSGSIVVSQTDWLSDGAGDEYESPFDDVFHYTNWTESGRLGTVDVGVRLRLEF